MLKKILGVASDLLIGLAMVFVLLEITLRLFPGLIPPSLLINFQTDLRQNIASRVGFTIESDTLPVERDDGGPPDSLYVYEPRGIVKTPPDYIDKPLTTVVASQMDDSGFCNPRVADHADIVAIGDSFSWCFNVLPEDTWYGKLASLSGYSVYSLGVPGIGPYDELQLFKHYGVTKSPKVVIMNIFEGNDFLSALAFQQYRAHPEAIYEKQEFPSSCIGLPDPLCSTYRSLKESVLGRTSYAFGLIANATRDSMVGFKKFLHHETRPNRRYALYLSDGEKIAFNVANQNDWDGAEELRSGQGTLHAFNDALRTFFELSEQYKFYPIITFTPGPSTVYKDHMIFEDSAIEELAHWYSDEQRRFFTESAEKFGYFYFDFTPALQEAMSQDLNKLLYFPSNGHLTAAGNAAVANALKEFLYENKILPLPPGSQ